MKALILFFAISSTIAFAETLELTSGKMMYEASHLIKTFSGKSEDLKGKIECSQAHCEFLLGAQVSSFVSNDSNRDTNMLTITEATKFPVVSGGGKIPITLLRDKGPFHHEVEVNFHGQKRSYKVVTEALGEGRFNSRFILRLEDHGVDRPSLFGVKIKNEVPLSLETKWSLSKATL